VSRPSSEISETDEDLGLTTLLGDGEALAVGRGRAVESATSGPGAAPAVTERVPAREPVIVSSKSQLTVVDSTLTQIATSSTTLESTQLLGSRLRSLHIIQHSAIHRVAS